MHGDATPHDHPAEPGTTAYLLQEMQLFGHRPFEDEPDPRPLPDAHLAGGAIADMFDALAGCLVETRIEPDLDDLLWNLVNIFHRAGERVERQLDDNEQTQRRLQREQDGSEIRSVELERATREGISLIERRDALEFFREAAADQFRLLLRKAWAPRTGSRAHHRNLTASMIDSRDFLDARLREKAAALLPEGTPFCEGGFYGERTKRFGRLLIRSPHMADLVMNSAILDLAELALGNWCERIQLNLAQAIELHPGALAQFPHRDQDMWQGALGEVEYLVNVMWPLTPFTEENGATIIWPGSHGVEALVEEPKEAPIIAEAEPGDAIVFLGSTLHGAGGNRSRDVRRGIIVSYCLGWLKPYENQWLAYPPEIARAFSPGVAALAGYAQHRPNLGNFEGQCPSVLFDGYPQDPIAAIDALRPDQQALLADYVAAQRPEGEGEPGALAA